MAGLQRYSTLSIAINDPVVGTRLAGLPFVDFLYAGGFMLHQVTMAEESRLDLISWVWYSDTRWWEVIAWANNIRDPLSVVAGQLLYIPVDPISVANQIIPYTYLQIA